MVKYNCITEEQAGFIHDKKIVHNDNLASEYFKKKKSIVREVKLNGVL